MLCTYISLALRRSPTFARPPPLVLVVHSSTRIDTQHAVRSPVSNLQVAARLERLERMEAIRIIDMQARAGNAARGASLIAENAARGTASVTRGVTRCEVMRTPAKS